jgi:hypothetical protein
LDFHAKQRAHFPQAKPKCFTFKNDFYLHRARRGSVQ